MPHTETAIVIVKTLTLVLGSLITYFSWKAYRRTESKALGSLAVGFGIITFGALLAGTMNLIAGLRIRDAILFQSSLTAIGFAVITYSLYVQD
ncbi:MAG: hypothetical protein SVG88_05070 [Halobacteriales archaeon]|nr:hypothetical protein [Halobacteriales archaeon]